MTIEDFKANARVTIDEDDRLIQSKIDAAEAWISQYIGAALSTFVTNDALAPPLQEAVRQLVSFFYDNREAAVVGNAISVTDISPGFYDLIAPHRTFVF